MRKKPGTAAWYVAAWRTATSTNTRRVITVCCLPGVLLAIAALYVREPLGLSISSGGIPERMAKHNPSREFQERQIGQVLFSPVVGDHCKRSTFDNRTGEVDSAEDVLCIQLVPEAQATSSTSADRIQMMRRTFRGD